MYRVDDVLISRTDGRGVITSANETFERVSGFSRDELIGAPHKIVRHPDMPRAVFHLIWSTLKRGEPISAFVKNKTKTGDYYWVLANVVPVHNGYMSIRTKPAEDLIAMVAPLYAAVRKEELSQSLDPIKSLELLRNGLRDAGHHGYWDFMSRVGAEQWIKRNNDCGRPADPEIETLLSVLMQWDEMRTICDTVLDSHDAFETSPLNLRIQAAQLGSSGRALDIIASSFSDLARQIRESMGQFSKRVDHLSGTIRRGTYLACIDRLVAEARRVLEAELDIGKATSEELDFMKSDSCQLSFQAETWGREVKRECEAFNKDLSVTKRNLTGLSLTRVMSAIENATIQSGSVTSIIEELRSFQEFSDGSLRKVQNGIAVMQSRL